MVSFMLIHTFFFDDFLVSQSAHARADLLKTEIKNDDEVPDEEFL